MGKTYSFIGKYIESGYMPRYWARSGLIQTRGKGFYKEAVEWVSKTTDYRSEEFLLNFSQYAEVLEFPLDSTKTHPQYNEIYKCAKTLNRLCKKVFPDKIGLWYILREGSVSAKYSAACKAKGYTIEDLRLYRLYCNGELVSEFSPVYAVEPAPEAISDVTCCAAELVYRVIQAPWLANKSWYSLQLPVENGTDPVIYLRCEQLSSKYFTNDVFSVFVEEYFSGKSIVWFKDSSSMSMYMSFDYYSTSRDADNKENMAALKFLEGIYNVKSSSVQKHNALIKSIGSSKSIYIPGLRYRINMNTCRNYSPHGRVLVLKEYFDLCANPKNNYMVTKMGESICINAIELGGSYSPTNVDKINRLCKKVLRSISSKSLDVNGIWYIKRIVHTLKDDTLYCGYGKEDTVKYGLYCDNTLVCVTRYCYLREMYNHSELELELARFVQEVISIGWVGKFAWAAIILPYSGITVKSFKGNVAVVGYDAFMAIKEGKQDGSN